MDQRALAVAARYTKSSPARLEAMARALHHVDDAGVPGDVVECGVWKAGNVILARMISPERVCWLYDTFSGMTKPDRHDTTARGYPALDRWKIRAGIDWSCAPLEEVREIMNMTGTLDDDLLRFVVGPVEETLLVPENLPNEIALLRLDTDWHASTKIELEVLWPRVVRGGVLIVDDYGHWMGARKAVNEYFNVTGSRLPFDWIDYTAIKMVKQ